MNPKSFPKRLDSKTGCLRITVPENLDLALEGLIRKVLREQPKTDDIYAFAANYFETLLRIRDRAGVEYTTPQLCPFHNDEEAREMIVLAGTFPKQLPGRVQGKVSAPLKTETEKEIDKAQHEKRLEISKKTLKGSKMEVETKQATPDLIKKLPLLAKNQGLNGEEVSGEKTTDLGPDRERAEAVTGGGDEEYSMSDPIKEFVEKELLRERNSKENEPQGGAPPVSNAGEKRGADGEDNPGAADKVGGVIRAGEDEGKRKIDPGIRETDEKGVEAGDEEGKIGSSVQPAAEGERSFQETQQKKETEEKKSEETGKRRAEEESENQRESTAETEAETEGVEAPLPPLPPSPSSGEKLVDEEPASPICMEADVLQELEGREVMQTQSVTSSEAGSPKENGIAEVGEVQEPPEDKNETHVQPSTVSLMKTDEESPETSSLVTNSYDSKPVENGARAAETNISQKLDRKETMDNAGESIARSEESQDLSTERRIYGSETGSSPERAKGVQEVEEGGTSFEEESFYQTKGEESSKGRKNLDIEAEDPSTPDLKSTEEAKLTSASAVEAERAFEEPQMGAEDSTVEPDDERTESSGKLGPNLKAGGSEILKPEQFSNSDLTGSDKEPEPIRGGEQGKENGDKKLSDEEAEAKGQSPAERRESPGNQTSPEEEFPLQKGENVQSAAEAPTEASTDADSRRTSSTTEGPKSEEQGDAKQEAPRDAVSLTGGTRRLTDPGETPEITVHETESAGPEDAPALENETASLPNEELCSVVDVNHLKRDEGNQEETEPHPENSAGERSAPEPEGSPSPSLSPNVPNGETSRENRTEGPNLQQEPEAEDETLGKAFRFPRKAFRFLSEEPPNATAVQEAVKPEADKEKVDPSEGTTPETREGFDPSARGKQIIIVEEPETTNENAEESSPPGEIQIKTIQTHYYDALRVPETVTREYRVHEMIVPKIDGLLDAATPPASISDETQESPGDEERSGRLTDDNAVPPAPKTSPANDGNVSPHAEAAEAQSHVAPHDQPSHVIAGSLHAVDGLDRDAQVSDSDDLPRPPTPTSDVVSNLEFSFQAASETFLTNEKRFSSLEKEEIRFVTLPKAEAGTGEPEERVTESGRGIEEGDETVLPSTARARPAPETPEGTEVVTKDGERPVEPAGGSPASAGRRAADGYSPTESASEKPVSDPRCQGEDESAPRSRLPSEIKPEHAEDVPLPTAAGIESAKESFNLKTQERNVLESYPEARAGSPCDAGALDRRSTERTPTAEASYAETDSTTSSATTEVKRTDSARRDVASGRSLSSASSLDLGKRNPLLRTRSLSTHRHGVADFEVWTTIEKELEEAATKIQSKFRGYKARKKLRREVAVQISTEESSKRSTPVEVDDADSQPRATGEFHDGIVLADHPR